MRLGTHLLHTSQTIVKNSQKLDARVPPLNIYDLYGLDCYDQSMRNLKGEAPADQEPKDKFNPVTFYSYLEDTGRTLIKLRIFSPTSQDDDTTQEDEPLVSTESIFDDSNFVSREKEDVKEESTFGKLPISL